MVNNFELFDNLSKIMIALLFNVKILNGSIKRIFVPVYTMNEEGIIIAVNGNMARVSARRTSACESCDSRGACIQIVDKSDKMEINAINTAGGKVGDIVEVSMESSSVIRIAMLVYMLPVVALFAGVFLGLKLGQIYGWNPELVSSLTGLFASATAYIFVRIIGKRIGKNKKYMPEILKILD